jgi:hypothetical protein
MFMRALRVVSQNVFELGARAMSALRTARTEPNKFR